MIRPVSAKAPFPHLLEYPLALIPPGILSAMSSVHMPKHMQRGFDPPDFLEQPFATQASILGYVEVPFRWIMRHQHVNIVRYGITPGILSTEVLKGELFATTFWYLRSAIHFERAPPGKSERDR